jgi:hypothetical protein
MTSFFSTPLKNLQLPKRRMFQQHLNKEGIPRNLDSRKCVQTNQAKIYMKNMTLKDDGEGSR